MGKQVNSFGAADTLICFVFSSPDMKIITLVYRVLRDLLKNISKNGVTFWTKKRLIDARLSNKG